VREILYWTRLFVIHDEKNFTTDRVREETTHRRSTGRNICRRRCRTFDRPTNQKLLSTPDWCNTKS